MKLTNKSLTLTELVIAIALLGVVFAAATSFNIASYNFYYSADKLVETQLAISPAMEQLVKDMSLAIGQATGMNYSLSNPNEPFYLACINIPFEDKCFEVHIRKDVNGTPNNYIDDQWVGYWMDTTNTCPANLMYLSNCATPQSRWCGLGNACSSPAEPLINGRLVNNIEGSSLTGLYIDATKYYDRTDGRLDITITARYNPSQTADPFNNPEVYFTSAVYPFSVSNN